MYNPHTKPLAAQTRTVNEIMSTMNGLIGELAWFRSYSVQDTNCKMEQLATSIAGRKARIEELTREIDATRKALPALQATGAYGLNPINWFSTEKRNARQRAKECIDSIASLKAQIGRAEEAIRQEEAQTAELKAASQKYLRFNEELVVNRVETLRARYSEEKEKYDGIRRLHDDVDKQLKPKLAELAELENRASQLVAKLNRANQLDRGLASASNSYEKAMAHQECEREFGDGSPRRVLSRLGRELDGIKRSIEKVKQRAMQIGADSRREIRKVVFDGSNLCVVDGSYIGLSALRPAVQAVAKRAKTIVVFDASLRRRFRMSDRDVHSLFGPEVTVHVAPGAADETVLDLAQDETTYVVSNDRFVDFREKAVVKQGRVIPHQIVDGMVFLRGGLNVSVEVEATH